MTRNILDEENIITTKKKKIIKMGQRVARGRIL
jgi:hypothetical protein